MSDNTIITILNALKHLLILKNEGLSLNLIKQYSINDLFSAAIIHSYQTVIEFLLENGADINQILDTSNNSKPIHVVIRNGNTEIFMLLLKYGVDTTSKTPAGHTPVALSVIHRQNAIFDELLKYEKNINHVDTGGNTLLHLSAIYNNLYVVNKLLENDIDIDIKNNEGKIAANYGFQKEINKNGYICRKLTSLINANNNSAKEFYNTIKKDDLYKYAVSNNFFQVVEFLLKNGFKTNTIIQENRNATDLHIAAENDFPQMVEVLLNNGADITARTKYKSTPISLTVQNNCPECFYILLPKEKNINHIDDDGDTLLHSAIRNGSTPERVISNLLESGIDTEIKNNDGKLAQHYGFAKFIENYKRKTETENSKRFLKLVEIFKNIDIDLYKISI